jgi:hypothetical protein
MKDSKLKSSVYMRVGAGWEELGGGLKLVNARI